MTLWVVFFIGIMIGASILECKKECDMDDDTHPDFDPDDVADSDICPEYFAYLNFDTDFNTKSLNLKERKKK